MGHLVYFLDTTIIIAGWLNLMNKCWLSRPYGTNLDEIWIKSNQYFFNKMPFNKSAILFRLSCVNWGRVMHICIGNLTIIGSDNSLAPGRRQAII